MKRNNWKEIKKNFNNFYQIKLPFIGVLNDKLKNEDNFLKNELNIKSKKASIERVSEKVNDEFLEQNLKIFKSFY